MQSSGANRGSPRQYRLYFLDGAGHVTGAPYGFEADDDQTAIKLAEAWREGRVMELWNLDRRAQCWP